MKPILEGAVIMKCPQCQNEFPVTNQANRLCPFCGLAAEPVNILQTEPSVVQTHYPMKWYKFLIYFALFASAVLNTMSGISYMLGTIHGDILFIGSIYESYPALRIVDIVYGLLLIGVAIMAIYTRLQLAYYREKGPMCLYILYSATMALTVISFVSTSLVVQGANYTMLTLLYDTIPSLVVSAVTLVLNIVYFRKRKELFVC